MKSIIKNNKIIILITFVTMLVTGCVDDLWLNADRLFRPVIEEGNIQKGGTWIRFSWDKYKGAVNYEIDLSVDSFKTTTKSFRTDSTIITLTNLEYDTKYQIRMRSIGDSIVASGDTIRSKYFEMQVATDDYPTQLINPLASDVIDKSIRVKWNVLASNTYSRIDVMVTKDSLYKSVNLTDADNIAGEKIISGLVPSKSYIVKIYSGTDYKGKKTFKTASSQTFEGDVVDLRDFSDDKAKNLFTQLYFDSLATAYPNGFNLILSGGTYYSLPTINIGVSMNMVTGLSFKGNAIVNVNGSFAAKQSTTVGTLRFEKIFFDQGTTSGKFKTDANFGGTYLINMNQTDGNFSNLVMENCVIKYKRGAIRMQSTGNISALSINNCLFDSIGGYSIVNNAADGSYIGDITVKKSSILHASKVFTCGKAKGINSLTVENVTFCYSPDASGYIFDYNTNPIPGGISVKNCLFGPGNANGNINGFRTTSTSVAFTNCYKTSDLTWAKAADGVTPVAPINDLIDLGKTSTDIFASPSTGNYKVTNTTLVNKVGDPRWW